MTSKPKHSKLEANVEDFANLTLDSAEKLLGTPEGAELGLHRLPAPPGETAIGLGRALEKYEHYGEGLPDDGKADLTFELRVIDHRDGRIELHFNRKEAGTRFKFSLSGLPEPKLTSTEGRFSFVDYPAIVIGEFWLKIDVHLAKAAHDLLLALYSAHRDSRVEKRRIFDEIMGNAEAQYAPILKWEDYKTVETKEVHGLRLTRSVPRTGRHRLTKAELKNEEAALKRNIFAALEKIEIECKTGSPKKTMEAVGDVLYGPDAEEPARRLQYSLKKYRIPWKDLRREYEESKKDKKLK